MEAIRLKQDISPHAQNVMSDLLGRSNGPTQLHQIRGAKYIFVLNHISFVEEILLDLFDSFFFYEDSYRARFRNLALK